MMFVADLNVEPVEIYQPEDFEIAERKVEDSSCASPKSHESWSMVESISFSQPVTPDATDGDAIDLDDHASVGSTEDSGEGAGDSIWMDLDFPVQTASGGRG